MLPWSWFGPPAVATMPRLPGHPPGLDLPELDLIVCVGVVLEETTVATIGAFDVCVVGSGSGVEEDEEDGGGEEERAVEEDVEGVVSATEVVAGIGTTVTVESDRLALVDDEETVASTAEVETASEVEVASVVEMETAEVSVEDVSTTGADEVVGSTELSTTLLITSLVEVGL